MGTKVVTVCDFCGDQESEAAPVTEDFRISTLNQDDGRGTTNEVVQFHPGCVHPMFEAIKAKQDAKRVNPREPEGAPQ